MDIPVKKIDIRLDRKDPAPLYHQVARELERAITDGRLGRGDYLENELLLAKKWRVSRLTLRRSIQELVDTGLLVRQRGVGTQVVNTTPPRPPRLSSLHDDLTEQGRELRTTVLAHEPVIADDDTAEELGLEPGSTVIHIERCRHVDGRRMAILRDWVTTDAAGDLTTEQLTDRGLHDLLRSKGIWPHSARQRITARTASPMDAALLDLPVGAPLLIVGSTMQDRSGARIEVSEQIFDARDYTMELTVVEG